MAFVTLPPMTSAAETIAAVSTVAGGRGGAGGAHHAVFTPWRQQQQQQQQQQQRKFTFFCGARQLLLLSPNATSHATAAAAAAAAFSTPTAPRLPCQQRRLLSCRSPSLLMAVGSNAEIASENGTQSATVHAAAAAGAPGTARSGRALAAEAQASAMNGTGEEAGECGEAMVLGRGYWPPPVGRCEQHDISYYRCGTSAPYTAAVAGCSTR